MQRKFSGPNFLTKMNGFPGGVFLSAFRSATGEKLMRFFQNAELNETVRNPDCVEINGRTTILGKMIPVPHFSEAVGFCVWGESGFFMGYRWDLCSEALPLSSTLLGLGLFDVVPLSSALLGWEKMIPVPYFFAISRSRS